MCHSTRKPEPAPSTPPTTVTAPDQQTTPPNRHQPPEQTPHKQKAWRKKRALATDLVRGPPRTPTTDAEQGLKITPFSPPPTAPTLYQN